VNQALVVILFTFLVVVALVVMKLRDLFSAVMLLGIFSLLSAALFTVMDAVDVAFTEAAVGAGISTILMLATLALTTFVEKDEKRQKRQTILPLLTVLVIGGALVYATFDMPRYGDPAAPIHHHVAPYYMKESPQEIGIPNVVTSVLASYRSYDTFGETTVIFTAGVGVMLLLGARRRRDGETS
jgi:multicomponent Na+:H+ antiporter subunit B